MLTPGQKAKILKYLLIGTSAGIGTNLTLNLISYLTDKHQNIKDKEKLNKSVNNSVKEIVINEEDELNPSLKLASEEELKEGFLNSTLAQALAILAAVGGSYAGYKGIDKIHDKIKNSELKEQEKAEAENYYKKLYKLQQLNKSASEEISDMKKEAKASTIAGSALGLVLLSALGTALLSRNIMASSYPKLKIQDVVEEKLNSFNDTPEKVKFVKAKDKQTLKPNESVNLDSDVDNNNRYDDKNEVIIDTEDKFNEMFSKLSFDTSSIDCNEALINICYELEKQSNIPGSATNIIKAASAGFTDELLNVVNNKYNSDLTVFDMADKLVDEFIINKKVASSENNNVKERIAITWLASDPSMSKAVLPQLAAEFAYNTPTYYKLASVYSKEDEAVLSTVLSSSTIESRHNTFGSFKNELSKIKIANASSENIESVDNSDFADSLKELLNPLSSDTEINNIKSILNI